MAKYPGDPERIRELLGDLRVHLDAVRHELEDTGVGSDAAVEAGRCAAGTLGELVEELSQTALWKIEPGEPHFTVLGRDLAFGAVIDAYRSAYNVSRDLDELLAAVHFWRQEHGVRLPT